jgi:hypothetical protein
MFTLRRCDDDGNERWMEDVTESVQVIKIEELGDSEMKNTLRGLELLMHFRLDSTRVSSCNSPLSKSKLAEILLDRNSLSLHCGAHT